MRLNELQAAESLADVFALPHTRAHWLNGNWKGYFSLDVTHPFRIYACHDVGTRDDLHTITIVRIEKIHDPH